MLISDKSTLSQWGPNVCNLGNRLSWAYRCQTTGQTKHLSATDILFIVFCLFVFLTPTVVQSFEADICDWTNPICFWGNRLVWRSLSLPHTGGQSVLISSSRLQKDRLTLQNLPQTSAVTTVMHVSSCPLYETPSLTAVRYVDVYGRTRKNTSTNRDLPLSFLSPLSQKLFHRWTLRN